MFLPGECSGWPDKVRNIVGRAVVVQSMRTGTFGEFVVLGSQYRDQGGELNWYVALVAVNGSPFKIHHVLSGDLPEGLPQDQREAMDQAICLWESQPESRPN
jgi:hypothetical protein